MCQWKARESTGENGGLKGGAGGLVRARIAVLLFYSSVHTPCFLDSGDDDGDDGGDGDDGNDVGYVDNATLANKCPILIPNPSLTSTWCRTL